MHEGVDTQLHSFLTSAPEVKGQLHNPAAISPPPGSSQGIQWLRDRVGPRAGLVVLDVRKTSRVKSGFRNGVTNLFVLPGILRSFIGSQRHFGTYHRSRLQRPTSILGLLDP